MKGIPLILISLIIAGGCIHTPAKVAREVPVVLGNITDSIEQNISLSTVSNQAVAVEQTLNSIKSIRV